MVSLRQKRNNNVFNEISSEEDDSDYEMYNSNNNQLMETKGKHGHQSDQTRCRSNVTVKKTKLCMPFSSSDSEKRNFDRRQKCFSKNALMARENRIKKKIYLQNLEDTVEKYRDENKKLSSILDNQSTVITDLRKEVKYLKNVLANSTDIGRLLKCINQNTGMPVSTSINNNIKINSTKITNFHPWAENEKLQIDDLNEINGELSTSLLSDFEHDSNWNDLFSDLYSPSIDKIDDFTVVPEEKQLAASSEDAHLEHNYTNSFLSKKEDVGVCLHIARHKVSLEFCSSCSENAASTWNED